MIRAVFYKNTKNGIYQRITVIGHSGFAKKGRDIVCSAVSAVVLANVNGCIQILKAKSDLIQEDGFLDFNVIDDDINILNGCSVLLETVFLALKELEGQYPSYIKVEVKEYDSEV